jgi:predicted metalloprotease with PDZ domain
MERIRARAIEPFDFEDANVSSELWLGEGFTSYYDDLIMRRSGLMPTDQMLASFAGSINTVSESPARRMRSAEEMSRLAPFRDAAAAIDRTYWPNTFISYYTWGAVIGLGLDLTLRDRSNGAVSLDDYMRALWTEFGRPGQKEPGMVATPYTVEGLKATLAKVSGDRAFADDFFARFIQGHEVVDYAKLLARAGLVVRTRGAGQAAFAGSRLLNFGGSGGAHVAGPVPLDSALYKAGVDYDDQVIAIDGVKMTSPQALDALLRNHKPGDAVPVRFVRRDGETVTATLVLEEASEIEIELVEKAGGTLTAEQQRFRDSWLGSKVAGRM